MFSAYRVDYLFIYRTPWNKKQSISTADGEVNTQYLPRIFTALRFRL